jgi:hypothetical protein
MPIKVQNKPTPDIGPNLIDEDLPTKYVWGNTQNSREENTMLI